MGAVSGSSQVQLSFQATIDAGASGMVTNTARFSGAGEITPTATTRIIAPAALTAYKSVDPVGPVVAGEYLTYTIVMTNVGGDAGRASLTDTIPSYTDYIVGSAQVSQPPQAHARPSFDGSALTWQGDLAPDETATITFRVQATQGTVTGTVVGNVAWLQELNEPGPLFNVTATNTTRTPVFTTTKHADPSGDVLLGRPITYTIVVTNVGAGTARVLVTDTIPTGTTCIVPSIQVYPETHALPTCVAGILTWQGDVYAYSLARLTFAVSQNITVGEVISNSAQVQGLSQPAEIVIVRATNTVVAPALDALKLVEPVGLVYPGDVLTYTIVMTNATGGTARVVVTDTIPTHTTYISRSARASAGGSLPGYDPVHNRVTWQGDVVSYRAVTLTFGVTVSLDVEDGTTITNVAWIDELSDPAGAASYWVTNTVVTGQEVYLPIVLRNH